MARIVSGFKDHDPNAPLLQGLAIGRQAAQARQEREAEARRQQAMELQMAQTAMAIRQQQAKTQEILNKAAEQGSVQAMEMARLRASMNPDQADDVAAFDFLEQQRGNLSPEAFEKMAADVGAVTQLKKQGRQRQAAISEIQRAYQDGIFGETAAPKEGQMGPNPAGPAEEMMQSLQARLDAGEDPRMVARDVAGVRRDKAAKDYAIKANQKALEDAIQIFEVMPPGQKKTEAGRAIAAYQGSPSLMEKEGTGPRLVNTMQRLGLVSDENRKEMFTTAPMPGLGGMTGEEMRKQLEKEPTGPVGWGLFGDEFGAGGPKIKGDASTTPGSRATRKQPFSVSGDPRQAYAFGLQGFQRGKDTEGLLAEMAKNGLLTADNQDEIVELLKQAKQDAAN